MAVRSENRRELRGAEAGEDVGRRLARPTHAGDIPGYAPKGSRQVRRRDDGARMIGGGAINNKTAAVLAAHDRERGCARMRAALGAARHVDRQRAVEEAGGCAADQRPERARRNFGCCANRRTRAGHHIAARIGAALEIVGTYCIEFFVCERALYVNEIAPRVHNSGHYSLDATQISQYEAHVRAICDLPLVEPRLIAPAVMVNILGSGTGDQLEGVPDLLRDPDIKLHLYGKRHAALRRKMGHFTVLGPNPAAALEKAEAGRRLLSWRRRAEAVLA